MRRLINLDDVEKAARRRLPRSVFDVVAGGAGDECTVRRNREAFAAIELLPRALSQVRNIDVSTRILGQSTALPVMIGPTGWQRMVDREAELAVARAAGQAGVAFALSTVSSQPLERVAQVATGPRWFQFYYPTGPDADDRARELVARAERAGYHALCLTVDTGLPGLRERDTRNRLVTPLRLTPRLAAQAAVRPRWTIDFLSGGAGRGAFGVTAAMRAIRQAGTDIASTNRLVSLEDLRWLRRAWSRPLVVKGVLRAEDCEQLVGAGVDGVVVSNHGGRQLDTTPATIDVLPEIVAAVAGRAEVFLDGGVRRGIDVIKALALGARACLLGRPPVYGLAVGGERGVARVLEIMRDEITNALGLVGYETPAQVSRDCVRLPARRR